MQNLLLGEKVPAPVKYAPEILQKILRPIPSANIQMQGWDMWNMYELFWLQNNIPQAAIGTIWIPRSSLYIVESKSLKLYLNSFNYTEFNCKDRVCETIVQDLSKLLEAQIHVTITFLDVSRVPIKPQGICLESMEIGLNIPIQFNNLLQDDFQNDKEQRKFMQYMEYFFGSTPKIKPRTIMYSDVLRSLCPVTSQPDFATVIFATTAELDYSICLATRKLVLSKNGSQEFHESCLDDLFVKFNQIVESAKNHAIYGNPLQRLDINTDNSSQQVQTLVYAHYTRRGGIDICPYRSNFDIAMPQQLYFARQ